MTPELELTITGLGAQGDGIAHIEGKTIFVPGALPDEKVRVCLLPSQDNIQRAETVNYLSTNSNRIKPPCPHFPKCGGCRLQHLETDALAAWKTQLLKNMLAKNGFHEIPMLPPITTALATRRRARLAATNSGGKVVLGFNEWHSHHLVDLTACPVLMPELVAFIHKLRPHLGEWLPEGKSCDIQITALPEGIDVVLIGGPTLGLDQRQTLAILAEDLDIAQLSWRKWDRSPVEPVAHRRPLSVTFGTTAIPFPPGSFLQATQTGETALTGFAEDVVGKAENIMDLFCGLGCFGLSAPKTQHVHFADLDGMAIDSLMSVAKHNPRWRVERRNLISDPYSAKELNKFDAIVFDPPRGGSKKLATHIAQSIVPSVVAISCDPPAFARDAKILMEGGYTLRKLQPVDQFLWSTHLELAAHFEKT